MNPSDYPSVTDTVLMIRPDHFGYNETTASSNRFQQRPADGSAQVHRLAVAEFEGLLRVLRDEGVEVLVFHDSEEPHKPDAIFPNNWITTHPNGTLVLYPMEGENRRLERRQDIVDDLLRSQGFRTVMDLTPFELEGRYLEGTGSMVFDRRHSAIYACLSSRTDARLLEDFAARLGVREVIPFAATVNTTEETGSGVLHPIYHTNVLMAIGESCAVLCAEAIRSEPERGAVMSALWSRGRELVEISTEQLHAFAGNMLQVRNRAGELLWVMSTQAYESLTARQRSMLRADGSRLLHSTLDTIERVGGGSARCMLAEIFRPVNRTQEEER